jgi:hypothetical protein
MWDWLVFVEAWWVLLYFSLALHKVSFSRLDLITRAKGAIKPVGPEESAWAWQRQKLVSMAAGFHLLSMTCLPRAFCLRWMLTSAGVESHLRIGTNRTTTGIVAHAWVEVAGENIGGPEDISERFYVLVSME